MKPGEMLEGLHQVEAVLPELLANQQLDSWESLDIDYEPPRVERLWRQHGDFRIYLHRIHPCAQALYHPHPWPSAIRILSGEYEMGLGFSEELLPQNLMAADREVARATLVAGASYEMVHPFGWHAVKPLKRPSLSLMVTAKPWDPPVFKHDDFGKNVQHHPLTPEGKSQLFQDCRRACGHWRWPAERQ